MMEVRSIGFPHSDIPGSSLVHSSPRLFAVTHVLLRHLAPRHPPRALSASSRDARTSVLFLLHLLRCLMRLLLSTSILFLRFFLTRLRLRASSATFSSKVARDTPRLATGSFDSAARLTVGLLIPRSDRPNVLMAAVIFVQPVVSLHF